MVGLADVRRWNGSALEEAFRTLQQRQQHLVHSGDDLGRVLPVPGWQGAAADDAGAAHRMLMAELDHHTAGVSVIAKAIAQASDAIPAVQREIEEAETLARKYGYAVGADGQLTDVLANPGPHDPAPEDRARARGEVVDTLAQALRTAEDIDHDLVSVFLRSSAGQVGTGQEATVAAAAADAAADPGLTLPEPPPNATPAQNAGWWHSMSPAARAILLRDHPDWLGNRDGLPAATRSAANLARLPAERARLQDELNRLQQQADRELHGPFGQGAYLVDLQRLDDIKARLASLDAIGRTMAQGNRQLLTLDTTGSRVKAAVAVGDVDAAEHVAVFVPGFTSTVDGSLKGYDNEMYQLNQHAQALSTRYGDRGQVATVTWIGYEAPQWNEVLDPRHSVISDADAQAGGAKLDGFLDGSGRHTPYGTTRCT